MNARPQVVSAGGSKAVKITVNPALGKGEELRAFLCRAIGEARAFSGCTFAYLAHTPDLSELTVMHGWENGQALDAYLDWRAGNGDSDLVSELMDQEGRFEILDIAEPG
ncbi:MAG: hypothetical protein JXQ89_09695 [Pelagimonas sp.]